MGSSHIFIVIKGQNSDAVVSLIQDVGPCLITFEKPQENPHFHILLQSDLDCNTIRNRITRKLQLIGSDRTVTKCKDVESATVYILKEGRVVLNTLYTDTELGDYLLASQQITNVKQEMKKARKESFKVLFVNNYTKIEANDVNEIKDHICEYIQDKFMRESQLIDRFIFNKFFYLILNRYYRVHMIRIMKEWSNALDL